MAPRLCLCVWWSNREPPRQMQYSMPNLQVTVPRFWSRRSESVFKSDRPPLGCEGGFAPQRLQAACVTAFDTCACFSLLTCATLAA